MIKKLTLLDRAFGITESDDNPKHVAGMQILELPEGADQSYVDELTKELKQYDKAVAPFNCVAVSFIRIPLKLKPQTKLDMNYHIQQHELDDVTDTRSLHKFVSGLHEVKLDRKKPLWQWHLIKSRKSNKFVMYNKVHHMYGDGYTLVKWLQESYSEDSQVEGFKPPWVMRRPKKKKQKQKSFGRFFSGIWDFLKTVFDFFWICFRVLMKLIHVYKEYMPVPFTGTKTVLTGQVKKGRVVDTVDIKFDRIYRMSKRLRASINEILLCTFDIATHRFLVDYGQTFDKALFTNMPINLRKPGDDSSGNKIAILPVELAHGTKDPYVRLRRIIENHRVVLKAAKQSQPGAFSFYTLFIQSFAMIYEMLRMSNIVNPIANILISNMPGPRNPKYFYGSKVKAIYPLSTITPGGGINFTLMTYDEYANVGIVCCDNDIKSMEPLVQYIKEAIDLLEKSIDDPTVSTDDIGELMAQAHQSEIVEPTHYRTKPNEDGH